MKSRALLNFAIGTLLCVGHMRGDTVILAKEGSVNGTFLALDNGEVKIEARSTSGVKTYTYKVAAITSILFNNITYNSGDPPILGNRPAEKGGTAPPPAPPGFVRLQGGSVVPCRVESIDSQFVRCADEGKAKGAIYPKATVQEIRLGAGK